MNPKVLMEMLRPLLEAVRDLAPIVLVILFFQGVVFKQSIPDLGNMLVGLAFVLVGLALFVRGLEIGMFPLGEAMAHAFAKKGNIYWLLSFAFLLGFGTTVAEPALIAVAGEAAEIAAESGMIGSTDQAMGDYAQGLRFTVALSVGTAIVLCLLGWKPVTTMDEQLKKTVAALK